MNTDIFIPTLRSFTNNNSFSGSCGMLRFLLTPDLEQQLILVKRWHGLYCLEKSTVEEEKSFPMTTEGIEEIRSYLISSV